MAQVRLSRQEALASINSSGGRRVLRELLKNGPCSRRQIAHSARMTEAAVSRSVQKLLASGVLIEKKLTGARIQRGRPSIDLCFSQQYFVAGIGIRGYTQWVEVRTFGGQLIDLRKFSCHDLTDPDSVLSDCCTELKNLLAARRIPMQRVLHLGILIVGVVDPVTGWVLRAQNLGWGRVEIRDRLSQLTGLPVSVENMLNGMNLQQQMESSSACESTLLVSVALGIGASVIIDDQVVRGHGEAAGQLGHQKSLTSQRTCLCGRIGCLDTVASGRALLLANQMIDDNTSPIQGGFVARFRQLTQEAQSRPDLARQLSEAGKELGIAVSAAIPLIDPEKIAFTGFVVEDDYFFNAVMDELRWYGVGSSAQRVQAVRYQNSGEGAATFFASLSLTMETCLS